MRKSTSAVTAASVFCVAISPVAAEAASKTITMSGSTSVAPLSKQLNAKYSSVKKGKVKFRLAQGGSDVGISDAARGKVNIGMSSRDAKAGTDPSGLAFYKIARDAICVVTNPSNPISDLSTKQVVDIFSGKITDWSQVPGAKVTGTIKLVGRNAASGTQDAFQKLFMGTSTVSSTIQATSSQGLVNAAVKSNANAIGYESFGGVTGLNAVGYNGVGCTKPNAISGSYGGVRNFWLVTKGAASGPSATYINWVRTSSAAKKIITRNYLPR